MSPSIARTDGDESSSFFVSGGNNDSRAARNPRACSYDDEDNGDDDVDVGYCDAATADTGTTTARSYGAVGTGGSIGGGGGNPFAGSSYPAGSVGNGSGNGFFAGADLSSSVNNLSYVSTTNVSVATTLDSRNGELIKPIVFGGLDGILTSFAIVAGAAGGNLSPSVVLILGLSNIFADALSMGVGEFLSSKANNEWILSERKREVWELENVPDEERQEMIDIYTSKGMSIDDADFVVSTMMKYKDFYVDVMMTQELELQLPEQDHVSESIREGMIMFASFAFFGTMPLLGYIIVPILFPSLLSASHGLFVSACVITGIVLFLMGSIKSLFMTQTMWYRAGTETLLLGGCCATIAYTVGQLVQE